MYRVRVLGFADRVASVRFEDLVYRCEAFSIVGL